MGARWAEGFRSRRRGWVRGSRPCVWPVAGCHRCCRGSPSEPSTAVCELPDSRQRCPERRFGHPADPAHRDHRRLPEHHRSALNSIGSDAPSAVRRAPAIPLVLQPAFQHLVATLAGRPAKRQACRLPLPALTLAGSPPHAYEHAPAPTAKGPAVTSRQQAAEEPCAPWRRRQSADPRPGADGGLLSRRPAQAVVTWAGPAFRRLSRSTPPGPSWS